MTAKTVASLLDAALPVGGTRGVAAHVADACGAAERTANGPALVDNTGSAYKMDSMDGANAPTPIIHIKTTVTPEEWLLLCKKEGSRNEGRVSIVLSTACFAPFRHDASGRLAPPLGFLFG